MQVFKGPFATRRNLFGGKDALGFETNVDQNLVLVNTHDYAIDYIAALDIGGSGMGREQRFHFVEVVGLFVVVVPL